MEISSDQFFWLKTTLIDKGNTSFYDFIMERYGEEPKAGAKTIRLKEMEDVSRILTATADWNSLDKSAAGVDGLSIMVQKAWPKQMPHPVPSTSSTPRKRKRTMTVDTTIAAAETTRQQPQPGSEFREMILENIKRTGVVSSINAVEFYGVANDFNPVRNKGHEMMHTC